MDDSLNNFLAEQQQQQQSRLNLNCSSIETDLSLFHMNIRSISNKLKLVITKCYGVRATTIEGDQITSDSPNERDQIAFCAFHSFLVEVKHSCDACVITTWRLGVQAPLVARN